MKRDINRDDAYWNLYLHTQEARITKFRNAFNEANVKHGINDEKTQTFLMHLYNLYTEKFYALYSAGADTKKLCGEFEHILLTAADQQTLTYNMLQWLLSVSILLRYEINKSGLVDKLWKKTNDGFAGTDEDIVYNCADDIWLNVLVSYIQQKASIVEDKRILFDETETLVHGELVSSLLKLTSLEEKAVLIKKHMEHWYNTNKGRPWYDHHKRKDPVYVGYWAFECAALAKIHGISSIHLKDIKYFPSDLLPT